jgi:hypothetical protein
MSKNNHTGKNTHGNSGKSLRMFDPENTPMIMLRRTLLTFRKAIDIGMEINFMKFMPKQQLQFKILYRAEIDFFVKRKRLISPTWEMRKSSAIKVAIHNSFL